MSSLGDILHALPTLKALRDNCPEAEITWAVHENFAHILPGKPYIDHVILVNRKKLKSIAYLKELREELHSYDFDMCLDLQCIAKSAIVSFLSGANEHYGYWELREGSWLINKGLEGPHKYGHVIERYLDTIRALDGTVEEITFPLPENIVANQGVNEKIQNILEMQLKEEHVKENSFSKLGHFVVIAPGARWSVKEWPLDNFVGLCREMIDHNQIVVLIGAPNDADKGNYIESELHSPYVVNLIGKTDLQELIEVIRNSTIFISADTGPLHIANALQKDLVALFGPTSPDRTGPYGGGNVHIIISPTSKATVESPLVDDPDCMKQITVHQVWQVCEDILEIKK